MPMSKVHFPKLRAQPLPDNVVTKLAKRKRPKGYGPRQPVTAQCVLDIRTIETPPLFTPNDHRIVQAFYHESRKCDERACVCTCNCHSGGAQCYLLAAGELPTFGHPRKTNEAHKRTHRECPKRNCHHT